MNFEDEKDYLMRIIKEMVRVLFSLMFGKKYVSVEQEVKNRYETAGKTLKELLAMTDRGEINEAENILLENFDPDNKNDLAAAALFYQHLSEKEAGFLKEHDYSMQEVLEGIEQLMRESGYGNVIDLVRE